MRCGRLGGTEALLLHLPVATEESEESEESEDSEESEESEESERA